MSTKDNGPALVVLAAGRAKRYGGVKPLAPVGPAGEPVLDLLADDALSAGFSTLVVVIGPSSGAAIRYHVEHRWPSSVDVRFAEQQVPRGTVDAVHAALDHLGPVPFAVSNADDLYGEAAFALLAQELSGSAPSNALVAFTLANAVIGDAPVTRGICTVSQAGALLAIDERRQVFSVGDGRFVAKDGREPSELSGDVPVSMNLWGFAAPMRAQFTEAMARAEHASEENEVLLPELVASLLGAAGSPLSHFKVLPATGRCIGVTHPDDLALVQAEVARDVGLGQRRAQLWTGLR
jgi:hypothetical protein